jgi:tRNA threonylcarbamoyladenosine biosynthesis protein TsaE
MTEWEFTLATINETAAAFWQALDQYRVFAFYGQMGAGKTSFIHALCDVIQLSRGNH